MESKFKLRNGNNDQTPIATARAYAEESAKPPVAAVLTKHALPPAFFTALQAKAAAFAQSISEAETAHGERVGTNAAFNEPARRGKKLVNKLSPVVKRKYCDNPQKLAEWLVASHVERAPKKAEVEKPPDTDKQSSEIKET